MPCFRNLLIMPKETSLSMPSAQARFFIGQIGHAFPFCRTLRQGPLHGRPSPLRSTAAAGKSLVLAPVLSEGRGRGTRSFRLRLGRAGSRRGTSTVVCVSRAMGADLRRDGDQLLMGSFDPCCFRLRKGSLPGEKMVDPLW